MFEFEPTADEKKVMESIDYLNKALVELAKVRSLMQTAEDKIFDSPIADRIGSLTMDLEELEAEVQAQIERMS